ncbi:MAG: GvpL/GvpF family gas vesicle protein [Desulfobacterales bacterium]|nr:GvpL/GvpF family gas vesicle protein [Desulfobacterales bacterium]
MKETIKKMVKQEIRDILAENEDTIREIVSTSLLPELRTAIRDSITGVLEEMVEEEGALSMDVAFQNVQCPKSKVQSRRKPDIGHRTSDVGPHSSDPGPQSSDIGPLTLDIGLMSGRYLYCIVEGSESVNLGRIGIEGNEVYSIPYKDLCAVVHNCPAEPYQSEDQEVVKGWIVAHQKVVDAAWERYGTVLPMGFDTIIRGNEASDPEENMRNWLKEDYENLKAKMEKVRGRAEYGVQVFWDSKVMAQKITEESVEIKKLDEEIKSKPRGLAYMYRQKLEDLLKKEMEKQADRYFKEFYERIKPHVNDLRVEKTKKTEDENKQMLMNLSCLLPGDGSKGLGDEVEKIDALEGFSVRYTGPWAPYSFV